MVAKNIPPAPAPPPSDLPIDPQLLFDVSIAAIAGTGALLLLYLVRLSLSLSLHLVLGHRRAAAAVPGTALLLLYSGRAGTES